MTLREFGRSLWVADGPTVPFLGIPYPTRMAIARLANGGLWVWSPVALGFDLEAAVRALGTVEHLVSPNKIHHLFLAEWSEKWPEARLHAPPGLAARKPEIRFHAELSDTPAPAWEGEIDQVVFRGSLAMQEVVFFHRPSRTALVCDLVQRHDPGAHRGLGKLLMRLDGLLGDEGSTPREWRASFLSRKPARRARETVLAWEPERLLIAHGRCAESGAKEILARALSWI